MMLACTFAATGKEVAHQERLNLIFASTGNQKISIRKMKSET